MTLFKKIMVAVVILMKLKIHKVKTRAVDISDEVRVYTDDEGGD